LNPTKPGLFLLPSHLYPKLSLFSLLRHWPLIGSTYQSDAEPEPLQILGNSVEHNVQGGLPPGLATYVQTSPVRSVFRLPPSNGSRRRLISPMFIRDASLIYERGNLALSFRFPLPVANLGHSVFPPWSTPHKSRFPSKYRESIFEVDAEFPALF